MSTSPTSTTYPLILNNNLDITYGTICIFCFTIGFPANILSFIFFHKKSNDLPCTLYKFNAINDSIICFITVSMAHPFLNERSPGFVNSNSVTCLLLSYLWIMSMRLSIYLVIVITLSRSLALVFPFRKVPLVPILVSIIIYGIFVIGQYFVSQIVGKVDYGYFSDDASCSFMFTDNSRSIFWEVVMTISYIIPVFVVLIFTSISGYFIMRKKSIVQSGNTSLMEARRKATITLVIFASIYLFFNSPIAVYFIIQTIDASILYWNNSSYFDTFIISISVALNATINPFLYMWRMHSFQLYILNKLKLRGPKDLSQQTEKQHHGDGTVRWNCKSVGNVTTI